MATFWRYVRIQAFVLLCGIVGPVFLASYFFLGSDPTLKWMFWTGLLITAADVLIALAITGAGTRKAAKTEYLEHQGVLALAQVTGVHETGTRINDQPLVTIDLRIQGPGLDTFDSQDKVLASLNRLPMITGRRLAVIVDPATLEYQIDWNRSALVSGMMPAQFTLDEDNRTYDLSGNAESLMEIMQILKTNGVPLADTIDIRSNPVVRQQVMDVVRRAAAKRDSTPVQDAPPVPAYQPRPLAPSATARLQELETLRATGTISDTEYTAKRAQIIAEL
ncbi:MAG: SHOCT domain-containing protein [Mycobacterium sp.]